jgi:hypothetical protein
MARRGRPWSPVEVEATAAHYFAMLEKELRGERYNKSEHRRQLLPFLQDRTETAVERKHQNISAVLIELGFPWIEGYKPLGNVQDLLRDVVSDRLSNADHLHALVAREVEREVEVPSVEDLLRVWADPPKFAPGAAGLVPPQRGVKEASADYRPPVNYLEREARNQALGAAGERFVLSVERARLAADGNERLASRVEQVSSTRGDGEGFDILSFESDTRERLIEVKTTGFGRDTPFFVTENERQVSKRERKYYHLYRVFGFRRDPRLFVKQGAFDEICRLEPQSYRGSFR